ncbi:hypothetical protein [Tropicimonas sp. S265A]|uniref:hypothetical protein n=1 Tax=Tropicimonas sp. S265A TaxID=3415134 RepID=UPI003C7DD4A5
MRTHFIATMITGAVVFLPLFALVFVVAKAVATLRPFLEPVVARLGVDRVIGVVLVVGMCLLVLVLGIYLLGLLSRATGLSRYLTGLDRAMARGVPGYTIVKSYLGGASGDDDLMHGFRPVIAELGDTARLGFEVDRLSDGRVVLFLPDAPNPQSGRAVVVSPEVVSHLAIAPRKLSEVLSFHGRGLELEMAQPLRDQQAGAGAAGRAGKDGA